MAKRGSPLSCNSLANSCTCSSIMSYQQLHLVGHFYKISKCGSFTDEGTKVPVHEVIIIIIIIIIIPFSLKANTVEMIHYYNYTKWKSLTADTSVWPIVTIISYHTYAFLEDDPSSAERCRKYSSDSIILSMFSERLMTCMTWPCRSPAEILGSNPTGGMGICLL